MEFVFTDFDKDCILSEIRDIFNAEGMTEEWESWGFSFDLPIENTNIEFSNNILTISTLGFTRAYSCYVSNSYEDEEVEELFYDMSLFRETLLDMSEKLELLVLRKMEIK